MITITEGKIAGLTPRWAPFRGFSLLFDNPGAPFRREGHIETLACDVASDPELEFYRRAFSALRTLGLDPLLQTYGLCALPPESYHVTAFDVANVADLPRCHPPVREGLRAMLDRLPASEAFDDGLLARADEFAKTDWNLSFRYGELGYWVGPWGGVIVIRLAPMDETAFTRFLEARAVLSRSYRADYGVGAGETYTPHVTLGYFMNPEGAERARDPYREWEVAFRQALGDTTLTFRTASLYGFTDMAAFFRRTRL